MLTIYVYVWHKCIDIFLCHLFQLYFLCGNVAISMIVGTALGLCFQRPWIGLEKAFTIKTKRDAFLVASNPLAAMGEEKPPQEVEDASDDNASRKMYDNIAYHAETPPPAYKEHAPQRHVLQRQTTQLWLWFIFVYFSEFCDMDTIVYWSTYVTNVSFERSVQAHWVYSRGCTARCR